MIYRELGSTGLRVSLLGLGALQWGGLDAAAVGRFLDVAGEAGVNHVDTARVYGGSEGNIGPALRGRRERFVLSSKGISRDLASFKSDIVTTFRNLETDYLDLFYIHSVGSTQEYEGIMRDGLYDHVASLKEQGLIRHIAVSSHDIGTAKRLVESGNFEAIMVSYNPAGPEAEEELLPLCARLNVGVVVMKPFGGGVLTEANAAQYSIRATAKASLTFCLANPYVSTVIPGSDRLEHVEQNLAIMADFEARGYTAADRAAALASVQGLGSDFCRGCGYCKPCPQGIDIPDLMGLYSRFRVFEHHNWQQMESIKGEYSGRTLKGDACAGCGECEARCPYKLPISETMGKLAGW